MQFSDDAKISSQPRLKTNQIYHTNPVYSNRIEESKAIPNQSKTKYNISCSYRNTLNDSRLPASVSRGVGYCIFLKKTLCIGDTESRRLPVSESRRLPALVSRGVGRHSERWVGESLTPCICESGSGQLPVLVDRGIAIWKECRFSGLKKAKPCLSRTNLAKNKARGVMNYPYSLFKGLKRRATPGNLVDFLTHQCGESFFDNEYICEFKAKIRCVLCKGPMPNRFMQKKSKMFRNHVHLVFNNNLVFSRTFQCAVRR